MAGGTDNSHLEEKVRVALAVADACPLVEADEVFMPYCGRGEAYQGALEERWPPSSVFALDRDVGCVKAFAARWPEAEVVEALAERADFVGRGPYRIGWFDAYNSPFRAVLNFLHGGACCSTVGLVLTTAMCGYMIRRSQTYDFARLGWGRFDREVMRQQVDGFPSAVAGWLSSLEGVSNVRQVDAWQKRGGSWIVYAGYVLDVSEADEAAASAQADGYRWRDAVARLRGGESDKPVPWREAVDALRSTR